MSSDFNSFVVFAEMRTGSNLLEAHLNAYDGLHCYGEAFNPAFMGQDGANSMLGVEISARDLDPLVLLNALRGQQGQLAGFRYFHDHDPRVLNYVLEDPRCAKIILTRNPVESYVSWKIAKQTGQWKLTDMKDQRVAQAVFDAAEFEKFVSNLQQFQLLLLQRLQASGQAAFYVGYDDLNKVDVINGIAAYLGLDARLKSLPGKLKKQNPAPLSEKVANFEEMEHALARLDRFDLSRTPNFEPRRGAVVPGYVAAAKAPLLYMPIKGGPEAQVEAWLQSLDGAEALQREFTQKTLRQWKRKHPGHRSFTVVTHPVQRAWNSYCTYLLQDGPQAYDGLRQPLRKSYKVALPKLEAGAEDLRAGFLSFLHFLKGNLSDQTSIRVDPAWASQDSVLQGFARFAAPDLVLRAEDLQAGLTFMAQQAGIICPDLGAAVAVPALGEIYDDAVEAAAKEVYQRDYMMFGYRGWGQAA